jgi:long-chain fatty acid transport protein
VTICDGSFNRHFGKMGHPVKSKFCLSISNIRGLIALLGLAASAPAFGQTGGALDNGISGRSISLGSATVASTTSPLEAMQGNPAGLSVLKGKSLEVDATSLFATGNFTNSVSNNGSIVSSAGTIPYGGFSMSLSKRLTMGISVAPDTLMTANWKYIDPPGGSGGTSYGLQQNKSAMITLRSAAGLSFVVSRKLAIGGTFGAIYDRNTLIAPYIFQEQPTLAGAKTLLNLHTNGVGYNGSFGALISPSSKLQIGLAYKMSTSIHTHGNANGDVAAQFATLNVNGASTFHYVAEVDTKFPQAFSGGISWQMIPRARLNLQGNWIDWSHSFDALPVKLTDGTNTTINSLVSSNGLQDVIPLHWRDQGVFGVGVESPVGEHLAFRGGYSYSTNPVPSATLTPMTAAILQNTIGTGMGYSRGRYSLDLAYQVQLPATESVGQSSLKSGEYDNSRVEVAVHSVTLTSRIHF